MLKTAARPLTVRDYRELPDGPPFFQLIEGDLEMAPAPNRLHQVIARNLAYLLHDYLQRRRIGEIYFAPMDVYLTDLNVYQPDLVYVAKGRRAILTDEGIEGSPNLVVEILSPRTAKLDRGVKRVVYARAGVEEMWIVDPDRKRVEVHLLGGSTENPAVVYSGRQTLVSRLFPGLKIPLPNIFQM